MPSIALATCSALPDGWTDDARLVELLRELGADVRFQTWDDLDVDWSAFDLVMVRSTWDYTRRREEFVAWAHSLEGRLYNPAAIIEWNSDKRYLADLDAAGIATVPTRYVGPADPPPRLDGEVVVKPSISAGARDTGRFGPALHDQALELIARIADGGRTAMVQPYLDAVSEQGETSIVCFEGAESHVLRKREVLGDAGIALLLGPGKFPISVVALARWLCVGVVVWSIVTFSEPASSPMTRGVRPGPLPWLIGRRPRRSGSAKVWTPLPP